MATLPSPNEPIAHDIHQANTPTNGEPIPDVVKPEPKAAVDVKRLVASIAVVCLTSLLLMCLVSGRWYKGASGPISKQISVNPVQFGHYTAWPEVSIWGSCSCIDINQMTPCRERRDQQNVTKGLSVIAAALEFFAVLVLLLAPAERTRQAQVSSAVLLGLAAVSLLVTFAVFGHLFDGKTCGVKFEDDGFHLDWAYGIRVGEFVFAAALAAVVVLRPRSAYVVFAVIVLLYLTVFTTTSRGWLSRKVYVDKTTANPKGDSQTWEYGLWNYCECTRTGVVPCGSVKALLRASEAFEIIAVATAVALTLFVLQVVKAPRGVAVALAWSLFVFVMLPWIFMAAVWNQKYCGSRVKDEAGLGLSWAFGLQVAISGLLVPVAALITLLP